MWHIAFQGDLGFGMGLAHIGFSEASMQSGGIVFALRSLEVVECKSSPYTCATGVMVMHTTTHCSDVLPRNATSGKK